MDDKQIRYARCYDNFGHFILIGGGKFLLHTCLKATFEKWAKKSVKINYIGLPKGIGTNE